MKTKLALNLLVLLLIIGPTHELFCQENETPLFKNFLGLHFGSIQYSVKDTYYGYGVYSDTKALPLHISYLRNGEKNIHIAGFQISNTKLKLVNEPNSFFHINSSSGRLYYEYYRRLYQHQKIPISLFLGIGIHSYGSKRTSILETNSSSTGSYDIAAPSVLIKLMIKYAFKKKHLILLNTGVPIFNFYTRPSEFNPRFNQELEWGFTSWKQYKAFQFSLAYFYQLSNRFDLSFNYQMYYSKHEDTFLLQSLNQNYSIGLHFKF